MNIPIIIVCYNNYKYVENTLKQILNINKEYYRNIQILNNNSNCLNTINYLKNVDVHVINNIQNLGPWITYANNKHIYDLLPDKFILTDPDLKLNENIPNNFIEIMEKLSDKYKAYKIGFALDISDHHLFFSTTNYCCNKSIYEYEKTYWQNKIEDNEYELYSAGIDTTFCFINKKNDVPNAPQIRICDNFVAKHIPWYIENEIYNIYYNYINNINTTNISTMSKIIIEYINNNYLKINKNNELFLIKNDNINLSFWKDTYTQWKNDAFEVFDKFLSKDKIFIDIGDWIGATTMYGSRKSKHVYSIEADKLSFNDMKTNMMANCANNYTLINKAIFNIDNIKVKFGKNMHLENSIICDTTSQFNSNDAISNEYYITETITLNSIIKNYDIDVNDISLINVDIDGAEENILNDLHDIHIKYRIPLFVSFYYSMWDDKNLDRFPFLSQSIKNKIITNPSISIIFHNDI